MLGHFLQFLQGGMNIHLQKIKKASQNWLTLEHTELLNSGDEHSSCSITGGSIGSSTIVQKEKLFYNTNIQQNLQS